MFPGWRNQDLNVRNDVCLGVIESYIWIIHCALWIPLLTLWGQLKATIKWWHPLSVSSAWDCWSAPYVACRKQFYFPLPLVSVQWGCLLHQASIHELFICVNTRQGGKTPVLNRLVIMAGLLFGRKSSNCLLQRLTDSYLRGGYYTAVNKMWERKSVCETERERVFHGLGSTL